MFQSEHWKYNFRIEYLNLYWKENTCTWAVHDALREQRMKLLRNFSLKTTPPFPKNYLHGGLSEGFDGFPVLGLLLEAERDPRGLLPGWGVAIVLGVSFFSVELSNTCLALPSNRSGLNDFFSPSLTHGGRKSLGGGELERLVLLLPNRVSSVYEGENFTGL